MFQKDMLLGQTAVVAGGTSGINLGIAKGLAAHGANVVVFGRDVEKASAAAADIGGVALGLSADVRDPDQVAAVVEAATERFGNLDIVVSGAAGNFLAPAAQLSPNGFRTVVDIDLIGTFNVFRSCFDHLNKEDARLIAVTAPQAEAALPYQIHACSAKAGINMMVKCLALEWGPAGIRVNAISPGPIEDTEGMKRLALNPDHKKFSMGRIASRRWGQISEIADAALFLCSPMAAYVNGHIFNVDGGMILGDASDDCLSAPSAKKEK